MAIEVAAASVVLTPTFKGVSRAISRELGGSAVSGAGRQAGQSWSSAFGSAIGSVAKIAGGALAGVGAALAGIAIKGGIDRALAIENAEAKLTGLGHSADSVAQIMENALNSVRGTAYGLGDAAAVAAGLVAAGVTQGSELEQMLKTVADTAAISGRSLTDIGLIFQSVAARGKLQGDDMLQLMSSGIPVLQLLADQLDVTSAEVSEMVSRGEVDFATFAAAMDAGFGGAALKSGETFSGALANVKAALGRLGASAAIPALTSLTGVFSNAIPAIDNLTASLTPLIEGLANRLGPAVETLSNRFFDFISNVDLDFSTLTAGLGPASSLLTTLSPLFASLLGPVLQLVPGLSGVAGGLKVLGGPIGLVIGFIATMIKETPALQTALGDVFFVIGGALQNLTPLFPVVTQLVSRLAQTFGGAFASVLSGLIVPLLDRLANDVIPALLPTISSLIGIVDFLGAILGDVLGMALQMIMPIILNLADMVFPALLQVISAVMPIISQLASAVMPLLMAALSALTPILAAVVPVVGMVLSALGPLITTIADLLIPVIQFLLPVVVTVFGVIQKVIAAAMKVVQGVIKTVTALIRGDWKGVWEGIKQTFAGVWDGIQAVVKGAIAIVRSALSSGLTLIRTLWNSNWGRVREYVTSIWDGIKSGVQNGINGVVGYVRGLKDKVLGAVSGAASWLLNAGRQVVQGFIDGIMAKFDGVRNTLSNLTSLLPDWKGPERRDKTILENAGELVIGGFISGMESKYGAVERTLGQLTSSLASTTPAVSVGAASGAGPLIQQVINPQPGMSEEAIGAAAARRLTFAMQG